MTRNHYKELKKMLKVTKERISHITKMVDLYNRPIIEECEKEIASINQSIIKSFGLVMLIIPIMTLGTVILFNNRLLTGFVGIGSTVLGGVFWGAFYMFQKTFKREYQKTINYYKEIMEEDQQQLNELAKELTNILNEINSLTEEEKAKFETETKLISMEDTLLKQAYEKGVSDNLHQSEKESLLKERENLLLQRQENDIFQKELEIAYELGSKGIGLKFEENGIVLKEDSLELTKKN